jgi:N-acetylglucosaminyldiphosphoundecaprenol N-acetyl-beta-D-mannosaminyltransferase
MVDRGKRRILGVDISVIDYKAAVEKTIAAAKNNQAFKVSALAVHGVMTGAQDDAHRFRLNTFDILSPDGQPVRWALRWLYGEKLADRVYGPDLTLYICEAAAKNGLPIFLFGSKQSVLDDFRKNLLAKFPTLKIAGTRPSAFKTVDEKENAALVKLIKDSGARLCFVGLGCPRQEIFTFENADALSMPTIAVGAAFDFHSGGTKQAPPWMQKRGLEWFYRLTQDPKRLWRRYIILNPLYLSSVFGQRIGLYRLKSEVKPESKVRFG